MWEVKGECVGGSGERRDGGDGGRGGGGTGRKCRKG